MYQSEAMNNAQAKLLDSSLSQTSIRREYFALNRVMQVTSVASVRDVPSPAVLMFSQGRNLSIIDNRSK